MNKNQEKTLLKQSSNFFLNREQPTAEEKEILKKTTGNPNYNYSFPLTNGKLLIMAKDTQKQWRHRVPLQKKEFVGPRICLTFRYVKEGIN